MEKNQKHHVKFLEAGEHATKAFEAAKQPLDLVTSLAHGYECKNTGLLRLSSLETNQTRLAILCHCLDLHQHRRLAALSGFYSLAAIQIATINKVHKWIPKNTDRNYPIVSLFTDGGIETKSADFVARKLDYTFDKLLRPQVVAISGLCSLTSLLALAWCCKTRTPAILLAHGSMRHEPLSTWEKWVWSRVVRLFSSASVGGNLQVDYVVALGLPRAYVFTGNEVIGNDYFSKQAKNSEFNATVLRKQHGLPDQFFLASGDVIEEQNISRLLEAYAAYVSSVGQAPWSLVFIGSSHLRAELAQKLALRGLADWVMFLSCKQHDELPMYYALAKAFIQFSSFDEEGLAVNEAMAFGLPVLVSEDCCYASDLVSNGVNGFIFNPYDIKAITARMLQISGKGCDLASMGRASREIIGRWLPAAFTVSMLAAVSSALAIPARAATWLDQVLLWVLIRRKNRYSGLP